MKHVFSKKERIKQLEALVSDKDRKINRLEDQIANYAYRFEEIQKTLAATPDDCKMGGYCSACEFSRMYHMYDPHTRDIETVHLCNKAGSCKNFIQRSFKNEQI